MRIRKLLILLTAATLSAGPAYSTESPQSDEERLAVVLEAVSLAGIPYIYGGEDLRGMDCSGLVYLLYAPHIPALPRRAVDQYRYGGAVATGDELPGDLVFFNTDGWSASHVGIYLGENRFVHAASGTRERGVIISSLSDPYYRLRYLGARRLR